MKEKKMYIIPEKALKQHIAILGKSGSGKTYTAKGIAEYLLSQGERVCIIDPTGVWWGLRSKANGKKSSFPVIIFGGEHQDVAINNSNGSAIAEIVGTTDTSSIIDTRQMSVGQRTRFFADFAETLLQKNKGALHLIIDEAHLFAPQGRVSDPQSGKMLHAANNLVSLGRGIGLRIILISQRPAKLHKDSLTQSETLIAMRLIAPQDRGAVKDWICEWAEPKQGKELISSLPSLKTGEGWIWSPEINLLKRKKFPRIKTYDSSSAPDGRDTKVELANIDLPSIQKRIEVVEKDIVKNDPRRMKMRIIELEKQLKKQPKEIDQETINNIKDTAWSSGFDAGVSHMKPLQEVLSKIENDICKAIGSVETVEQGKSMSKYNIPPTMIPKIKPKKAIREPSTKLGEEMSTAERKFLTVLAQRGKPVNRNQIAIFAGYSVKSGHVDNTLGALRSKEWATGRNDCISITESGYTALGSYDVLPSGDDLRSYWIRKSDKAGAKFLRILFDIYPLTITRNDLAEQAGYSQSSGHVDNTLGRLRSLDLAEGRNDGIKASDNLFEEVS